MQDQREATDINKQSRLRKIFTRGENPRPTTKMCLAVRVTASYNTDWASVICTQITMLK